VLAPILTVFWLLSRSSGLAETAPNLYMLTFSVWVINLGLLIFNMLPVYPLDGGQILRALLWFPLGRAKSLMVAAIIGFAGVAGLAALALKWQSVWVGIIAVFVLMRCLSGYKQAQALMRLAEAPRHEGFACPSCKATPPKGALWVCGKCRTAFDTFETHAACPNCGTQFQQTRCLECGTISPICAWASAAPVPVPPSL
jgi:hypothetical protein